MAATSSGDTARYGMEVDGGDPLRHDDPFGIRTCEEDEVPALLATGTSVARAARRRVRRDDALAVDESAELMTEWRRRLLREQRMPAPEGLQIGPVGEGELDLDEHVAWPRLRARGLLDAEVARPVEHRRSHGVKTTFSASPRR